MGLSPVPTAPPRLRRASGLPEPGRCLVMGILNVTPDSFSDGGAFLDTTRAIDHGLALAADGADIVDVGGESTRPGAHPVPIEEELSRVIPVIRELARCDVFVSIDTMHAAVARAAVDAGARLINDVSGGLADPLMAQTVAVTRVPYVVMHWRAPSKVMQHHAVYTDVVEDVRAELKGRIDHLCAAGVREDQILVDPGLGFAKRPIHDWTLLAHLDQLGDLGFPVLIGASRKSFIGALLGAGDPTRVPPHARDTATAALSALAATAGAHCVRVHNVPATLDAIRVAVAWNDSTGAVRLDGAAETIACTPCTPG